GAEGAQPRRRARRRPGLRRSLLRQERHPPDQAGRVPPELPARPRGPDLDHSPCACVSAAKFYGKYRGTVVNNIDPERKNRIQVEVPDVLALTRSSWAMPCVPFAGIQAGVVVLPTIGAGVWVEFEQGNPNYPIWVGGFWGSAAEVPALAQTAVPPLQAIVLQ